MLIHSINASTLVSSEADLISILEDTQVTFQGISPPSQAVFVTQSSIAYPVDWSGFDKKTTKYMTAYMDEYGLPRYALLVYEDSVTRDRVITLASTGFELARISAPKNYVPESYYTGLLSRGATYSEFTRWVFDPAHTAVQIELVPYSLYASYEMYEAQSTMTAEPMMMTTGIPDLPTGSTGVPPVTVTTTNANKDVEFTFPLPADFGGHAEIFKTTNLKYVDWWVAETRVTVTAGTDFVWTDVGSSNQPVGYFILSSADADFDGDGFSDLREKYMTETNDPTVFDMVDDDGDGMHDWYEITLFGGTNAIPSGDADNDTLKNSEEMILHPAVGTNSAYVTFNSQPDKWDTDGDEMHDGLETVTYTFLDPNDPSDKDYDNDGLDNLVEHNVGTELDNWDTDNDTLSDYYENEWDATDPNIWNDPNYDGDGDGLSLYEEYQYGTDPSKPNTDNDGTDDGDEVAQGSSPTDGSDGGNAPAQDELMTIKLTVGDDSNSHSERYQLKIDGERTITHENAYGTVQDKYAQVLKGKTYSVTLRHIGTTQEHLEDHGQADFDFESNIAVVDGGSSGVSVSTTVAMASPEVAGTTNQILYTPQAATSSDPVILASTDSVAVFTGDTTIRRKYSTGSNTTEGPMSGGVVPSGTLDTVKVGMERSGNTLGNNGYAFITTSAEMPDVVGKIYPESVSISADWNCDIVFDRYSRSDSDSFSESGDEWSLQNATGGNCYGGKATLSATISGVVFTNSFHVRGWNPSEADVETEIGDDPFFAKAIARHESGTQDNRTYLQFNETGTLGTDYQTDLKNTPNRSSDLVGWGIYQLSIPAPTVDEVWSWRSNVSAGLQRLSGKESDAQSYFNAVQRTYPAEWESPPSSYTPPSCTTSLTALEAATLQMFNRAAVVETLMTPYGTYTEYGSCWRFIPNNPSGQRWEFVPNVRDYVKKVILKHESN